MDRCGGIFGPTLAVAGMGFGVECGFGLAATFGSFFVLNDPPNSRPGLDNPTSQMGAFSSHSTTKFNSSKDNSMRSMPVEKLIASPLAALNLRPRTPSASVLGVVMRRRYSIRRGTVRKSGNRPVWIFTKMIFKAKGNAKVRRPEGVGQEKSE